MKPFVLFSFSVFVETDRFQYAGAEFLGHRNLLYYDYFISGDIRLPDSKTLVMTVALLLRVSSKSFNKQKNSVFPQPLCNL